MTGRAAGTAVELPCGKESRRVLLPAGARIVRGRGAPPLPEPARAVERALLEPAGPSLKAVLAAKRRDPAVCIVVSDHTRAVPNRIVLPPLLRELATAGIARDRVTILVASGMHRPTTPAEKAELLGRETAARYRVVDHEARNPEALEEIRSGGRTFAVNRIYARADVRILTGLVEPHFMAGFSGGRKAVCPGIAGMETIRVFHGPALLESPFAKAGTLARNPCHAFALAMARAAGADFIVNVTLDRENRLTGVFAGDLLKAHAAAVARCRRESLAAVERPFDVVVTTNGGHPLDRDLYQTVKGLVSAAEIVAPGGRIVCLSGCADGVGSADFRRLLAEMRDPDSFVAMISRPGFFVPDQWEVEELAKVLRKAAVFLCSPGLTDAEIAAAHMTPARSVEDGVACAVAETGGRPSIAAIPGGPYTIAAVRKRSRRCTRS